MNTLSFGGNFECRLLSMVVALDLLAASGFAGTNSVGTILTEPSKDAHCVNIVADNQTAQIVVDANDYPVVQLAANFFADDARRVCGHRPIVTNTITGAPQLILAGTLGHCALIDQLAAAGKLKDVSQIQNRWEAALWQVVEKPFPNVERALVIAGSDRRGAAYGLMRLSEEIGVSPWYWWADAPMEHHDSLAIKISAPQTDAPRVKYRGIFINDEDWGLNPWASKTFDPQFGNIGPKTYEKVFELMLRLRLNYIWPAMHACSVEFSSSPENISLADKFGIVAGSSHCEPMLCNNVHWNEREKGPWNYSINRAAIHSYWEENVKARATEEAVWTLGIRGIHDAGMERPPSALPAKISLMTQVIADQRALLEQNVTQQWGPVAQCFVPYKEVMPIYDAGLKLPDDVTLVWVDDNFGYIRRLSAPAERQRPGGAGVYWHLSYYGQPHSYTWINTTAPALMWEELHKAWENDARNLWVINVGDIKPMEIGISYFAQLAWNPEGFELGAQRNFLADFAAKNFGEKFAQPISDLLMKFYRLGATRKPELMDRSWALGLDSAEAKQLGLDYRDLLARDQSLASSLPPAPRDAYAEMVGIPARVLADTGLIFMTDRAAQLGANAAVCDNEIGELREALEAAVREFNTTLADGKWNRIMPGLVTGRNLKEWSSQVRWPWGESTNAAAAQRKSTALSTLPPNQKWRAAGSADREYSNAAARWDVIEGLGPSGRAVALLPASLASAWSTDDTNAPALEYDFSIKSTNATAVVEFAPTFRICPGMKLRVAATVDDLPPTLIEVPGSSGNENENGIVRSSAVQNNFASARIPLTGLAAGKHVFKIRAIDPGVVIDQVSLP